MSDDAEVTGERLTPRAQRGDLVYAEHLSRYRFATQFAAGRRVLDIACGEGYGTAMLAAAGAAEAVGGDIDAATVADARDRYGLEFVEADVASLTFDDDRFDLIVCFETIEHVADADAVVAELRRVLSPEGLLLISTPNAGRYLVDNPFHIREFESAEFSEMLREHFPEGVRTFGQFNLITSLVAAEAPTEPEAGGLMQRWQFGELLVADAPQAGDELYVVAGCGPSDVSPGGVAFAAGLDESHALSVRVLEAERQVLDWHRQAMDAVKEVDAAMAYAQDAERRLQEVRESRSWRITAPLRFAMQRVRQLRARRR